MDSLGEDLMLLAIDPANGVMHSREHLRYGLMGAELIALHGLHRIEISDGRIVVTDATPTGDPELDAALAGLGAARKPQRVRRWVGVPRRRIEQTYVDRLVVVGAIGAREGSRLRPRWPVFNQERSASVRARVDAVALASDPAVADDPKAALAALVGAIGLARSLYLGTGNQSARKRLNDISKTHWAAGPVRRASSAHDASTGSAAFG